MKEHYKKFVEQAFIDPIRSVIIVDDDYPTIQEVLDAQIAYLSSKKRTKNAKSWDTKPQPIKDVIAEFRDREKPYMLDIHDAQTMTEDNEVAGAAHLHQTDLLILDYELEPEKKGDGTRSLKIARKLMSNSHFNLVVVNTDNALDSVFQSFLLGLLNPCFPELSNSEKDRLEKAYEAIDYQGNFSSALEAAFDFSQYVSVWQDDRVLRSINEGKAPFVPAKKLFEKAKLPTKDWKLMAQSALFDYQKKCLEDQRMREGDLGIVSFSNKPNVKWIRSDKAFITFSHKPDKKKLLDTLKAALEDWSPKPSRLVVTKMLAEIDEHGVELQDIALSDNHSSALWYRDILDCDEHQLKTKVEETVQRHVEEMFSSLLSPICNFTEALATEDKRTTKCANLEVVQDHYRVDLSDDKARMKAQLWHNVLACCQSPRGWHLQSGHVFKLGSDAWVCVSPLCDTVPSQLSSSQRKVQGDRLRFNALRLHKVSSNKLPDDVQSNRHIFLKNKSDVDVYAINENANAMPDWGTFLAAERGVFNGERLFSFSRIEEDPASKNLIVKSYETQVIAHLRYEYALNFINKLSSANSRIGLDFTG